MKIEPTNSTVTQKNKTSQDGSTSTSAHTNSKQPASTEAQTVLKQTLKQDTQYNAEVIKVISSQEAPKYKNQAEQITLNKQISPNQQSVQNQASKDANHALIKLNGQLLIAKSTIDLPKDAKLLITVPSTGPQKGQITLLNINPSQQQSSGSGPYSPNTSYELGNHLIQQLTKLLSQQTSLNQSLNLLATSVDKVPDLKLSSLKDNSANNTTKLSDVSTQTAIKALLSKLTSNADLINGSLIELTKSLKSNTAQTVTEKTRINQTIPTNKLESLNSGQIDSQISTIKNWLKNSGLFYEHTLMEALAKTQGKTGDGTGPSNTNLNAINRSVSETTQLFQSLAKTLSTFNKHSSVNSSSQSGPLQALDKDLKANLLSFVKLLSSDNVKATTSQTMQAIPSELSAKFIDEALNFRPFDFPKINTTSAAKAQAALADVDLSVGQLLKLAASMLNRIQFNQLNSVLQSQNTDNALTQSLFFELPLVNQSNQIDMINLRIDKKEQEESETGASEENSAIQWKLNLAFNLDGLGPLTIQVTLTPPSISSVVWAEQAATYELVKSELKTLQKTLSDIGLDVGELRCQQGSPKHDNMALSQSLIDIEA